MKRFLFGWCLVFAPCLLPAQSHEIGFLFGFSQRNASIRNDVIEGEVRVSMQVNLARKILDDPAGRVYVELPVLSAAGLNGKIDRDVTGQAGGVVFVTPGLRGHLNLGSRFSVYVAAGIGLAVSRIRTGVPSDSGVITTNKTYTSSAGNYGGGVECRISSRWSLRAEARDFRAKKEARIPGRNTVIQAGFAFGF